MSSNNYQVVAVPVGQTAMPTGEGSFINNASTYGLPLQQTAGVVAGNTERLLRKQIGEWARLILFLLGWLGMVGYAALLIWIMVIIGQSPNSPPIEAVQLIPGFVSVIATAWILMMLETSGRIKFYIYTAVALLFVATSLVIIILWWVYFTSFIFTCSNPDPATLAVFLCQSGVAENTEYASFAFSIVGAIMTLVVLPLVPVVGILAPPEGSDLKREMTRQYWMRALQIPTTRPRITIPNFQQYFPGVTRRNNRNFNNANYGAYETVHPAMSMPVSSAARSPWGALPSATIV